MWSALARFILRRGPVWLVLLAGLTAFFGWHARQVKLSYEFTRAIPTDNPKYIAYEEFRRKFGEDGNLMVIGLQTPDLFRQDLFNDYRALAKSLKGVRGVTDIIAIPAAANLVRDEATERLQARPVFADTATTQADIDSARAVFMSLPFYRNLLYNPDSHSWLMGLHVDAAVLASPDRLRVVGEVATLANAFGKRHGLDVHLSGLPLIRTELSDRIQKEMRFFLIGSLLLSAVILLLFFRSVGAMLLSLGVVLIGVVWSLGTMHLLGYKITLLTALIPPLIVVIGIPNCIYFLNKYHSGYRESGDKDAALTNMIAKMGVVTLFCNLAAAIGFAVFALTRSAILKEFGLVAGINILLLFFISLLLIPVFLQMMPPPSARHIRYLDNAGLQRWLGRLETWAVRRRGAVFGVTALVLVVAVLGLMRLKSVGYIVDDLPQTDKIYTDLKFFEREFKGVMPLEIVIDTKKKYGVTRNLGNLARIDSLVQFLAAQPYIGKPLTITEGLKFAKQGFFEGDSSYYALPGENDLLALRPYLSSNDSGAAGGSLGRLVASFMDSGRQQARISVSMMDVGSARLPAILDSVQTRAAQLFDSTKFSVQLTGTSVTFLEGSRFIINGLKESVLWAFLLISLCMLYLFRSGRILLCSLLPNVIPLVITAGVMGWAGVPLKPSTVLVFSVALGIAIDITIRFLVNFKQQARTGVAVGENVAQTIHSTGLSIIYTSVVLIAGFIIFCFSGFGGTKALGWLTSLTLITATVANLVLLPALLLAVYGKKD